MTDPVIYESKAGPIAVAPYAPGDEAGILELFEAVFGRERDPAEWNWLFGENPDGFHAYLGKSADGRVVSQFAGIPTPVLIRGREYLFGQIVDSMVHPDFRGALKRKGLFATTVDAFVDRYGKVEEEVIMMGLPNPPAFRIGRKLCGYVPMGHVYFLTKEIEPEPGLPEIPAEAAHRGTTFKIAAVREFSDDLDELEARLAPRHEIFCRRDKRRLDWRYGGCPESRYHALEIRTSDDALVGIAVGVIGYLDRPDGVIAEWLVDDEVTGAREALVKVIEDLMRRVSMKRVQIFLNHVDPESRAFEDLGYSLVPTHYRMVSRTYAPEVVTPPSLGRGWYYTLGDFDVV